MEGNSNFAATLAATKLKKEELRDALSEFHERTSSIVLLSLRWKDLQDEYETLQTALEQRSEELRVREESLQCGFRVLRSEKKQFEDSADERLCKFEAKRRELQLLLESKFMALKQREEEFTLRCTLAIEDGRKEIQERVEEVERVRGQFETRLEEISEKEKQFEVLSGSIVASIDEKLKEIEVKENQLNLKEEELEMKNKELVERFRRFESDKEKFELKEKDFEKRWRELEIYAVESDEDRDKLAEQLRELELKDLQFKERMEEIEQFQKKCDADRKKLEERKLELDQKEKQLDLERQHQEKLELERKDLVEKIRKLESDRQEFNGDKLKMDEELELERKDLEEKTRKLESDMQEFNVDRQKLDDQFRELEIKTEEIEKKSQEHESGKRELEVRVKQLRLKENWLKKMSEMNQIKNDELESNKRKFEADRARLEELFRAVELNIKKSNEAVKELESKGTELEEGEFSRLEFDKREFKVDREEFDDRCRELEIKIQKFEENRQELESSKVELECRLKQVKLKQNSLDIMSKEIELKGNKYENLCKEIVINWKNLLIFLNGCWGYHEKMGDGVSLLLRLSNEPAKLVLDALEGFFPSDLINTNGEFTGSIAHRSCILLLEQLLKISPDVMIKPEVKNNARRLSSVWITKLKADKEHFMEIMVFLLVLANYDLASDFDMDELFNYVKIVAHFELVPELCCFLGMADRIPDLIQDLVERKQHLVAIAYVFTFNLVEKFPPVYLIKDHMESSKIESSAIIGSGHNSREAQIEATSRMISDLKSAIRYIEKYNIASSELHSPGSLRQAIASLEKHQMERTEASMAEAPNTPRKQQQQSGVDFSLPRNNHQHHEAVICTEDPFPKKKRKLQTHCGGYRHHDGCCCNDRCSEPSCFSPNNDHESEEHQ